MGLMGLDPWGLLTIGAEPDVDGVNFNTGHASFHQCLTTPYPGPIFVNTLWIPTIVPALCCCTKKTGNGHHVLAN